MELSSQENKDPMNIQGEEKQDPMMIEENKDPMIIQEKQESMMMEEAPTILLRSVIDNRKYRVEEEVALYIPVIRARHKVYNTKLKNKTMPEESSFRD